MLQHNFFDKHNYLGSFTATAEQANNPHHHRITHCGHSAVHVDGQHADYRIPCRQFHQWFDGFDALLHMDNCLTETQCYCIVLGTTILVDVD
jgi:hypothetical protein